MKLMNCGSKNFKIFFYIGDFSENDFALSHLKWLKGTFPFALENIQDEL